MKTIGQLVFTAIEAVTVTSWLTLVDVKEDLAAISVLFVGFFLEHFVSFNVKNERPLLQAEDNPIINQLALAGAETVTWAGWLALLAVNPVLAFTVLFAGLSIGHIAESNSVNHFPLFHKFGNRLLKTLDITAIESVIATVWLALVRVGAGLVGFIGLFIGLFIEHFVSGRKKFAK
jgi:hypothetical protein